MKDLSKRKSLSLKNLSKTHFDTSLGKRAEGILMDFLSDTSKTGSLGSQIVIFRGDFFKQSCLIPLCYCADIVLLMTASVYGR